MMTSKVQQLEEIALGTNKHMKDWDLLMDYTILQSECATWICWGVLECAGDRKQ